MVKPVYVPEAGGVINFPDDVTPQQMQSYIDIKYPKAVVQAPSPESGIGALEAGFYGSLGRSEAAAGKAAQGLGIDWLAQDLFNRSRANEQYIQQYKPDVANISDIQGVGDVASFAGSTIGQSATDTATGLAGAYAGMLAGGTIGSVVPFVGTAAGATIGGIVGGALAALPSFVGGNLQRQAQEQNIPLEETSGYAASAGAVAQAPLDAAFDTLIAKKFPGSGVAFDVIKKSFLKEVASTAAKGAATEALTEPAQQAIELAQSNPEKLLDFGPDVQNEILNAAAGGALAGGIIGGAAEPVARVAQGYARGKQREIDNQLAADVTAAAQGGEQMKRFAEVNSGVEKLAAQPSIGQLKLGKVQIDPTPENGLKAPITRFQILDNKNQSIAEFSDPVHATDAVNTYSKLSGKKINLVSIDKGKASQIPTVTPTGKADVSALYPQTTPVLVPGEGIAPVQKPKRLPKKMAQIVKKADLATRLQPIPVAEIPYESVTWDPAAKAPKSVAGKSKIVDYGGRKMMVVNVNGTNVPFYLSSGLAGKSNVPSGKWYPFFGIGADGWINKTSQEEIANYYGDEDLKRVAQTLDATVGDIRGNNSIPRIGTNGAHTSFINSGLEPSENGTPQTLEKVSRNIKNVLDKIRSAKPVEQVAEEAQTEPMLALPAPEPTVGGVEQAAVEEQPVGVAEAAPVEAQPAVAEPIPAPPAPENAEFDTFAAPPVVDQIEQEMIRKAMAERRNAIGEGVRAALKRYNLKDVETKFVPALLDKMGKVQPAQGSEVMVDDKSIVKLATDVYDPNLSVEDMVNKVIDALNHESIHSLFDLGLIRPAERQILLNAVENAKVPGKKYTYLDFAKLTYDPSRPGLEIYSDPNLVREEAVAEMFRDWRKRGVGATTNTRGLFNRVIDALRNIFNVMRRNSYEDVFKSIESGEIGLRERAPVADASSPTAEKTSIAPEMPKLAVAPVYPYGQRVPQVLAADTNRVLENVEYASIVNNISNLFGSRVLNYLIPDKLKPSYEGTTDFLMKWADRRLSLAQAVDFVKANGGTVSDALDVYAVAQLSDGIIAEKLRERNEGIHKKLISAIKDGGLSFDEFNNYVYAKHAPERNDRMRKITPEKVDPETGMTIPHPDNFGSGMSYRDAADIVNAAEAGPKGAAYRRAYDAYREIIADTNALRVEGGLSPDFDNMVVEDENGNPVQLDNWEFYAPLRGFADEHDLDGEVSPETQARLGQGFKIKGREDRRAFGRTSKAGDILAHTLLQNEEAVIRAEKNKVGQSFLGLIQANPDLMREYGVEVLEKGKKPMKKYVSSSGVVKSMVDPMYKNRDDVLVVKVDGQEVPIKIDNKFLQRALIGSRSGNPATNSSAIRFFAGMNRFLAAMNTVYNPEFSLVNFPRDLQQAALNLSQYEIKGLRSRVMKDSVSAVRSVYKILRDPNAQNEWSGWYDEFRKSGGQTSGFYGAFTVEEQLRKIDKMATEMSGSQSSRAKQAFDSVVGIVSDINGAFENAVRLAIYKNVRELGGSPQKAAFLAKNTTINFDQRGEKGAVANSLYLFFNASVQGTMALGLAASRSKKVRRALGALVVFGVIQDIINSQMSEKDEDGEPLYDKIPDYKLENNIVVVDPFGISDKGYLSFPLAYGANAFVNLGRSLARTARGGYKSSEALNSIGWTFVDAFNPVGGTESFLNFVVPTALDPFVALAINSDYSGKKIYPEAFPGSTPKANSQTFFSSTSPSAVWIAEKLNSLTGGGEYVPGYISIQPDILEYMYDYVLGATGATARRVFDGVTSDLPKALSGDLEEIDMNNMPVLRKLFGNVSERIQFDSYADKVNHILTRGEEYKYAVKQGDPVAVKNVREKYKDELSIYPQIKALVNRRNKIASDLRKLKDNTSLPPEQRRQRQDALRKQIEDIMNQVDKLYQKKIGSKYPNLLS